MRFFRILASTYLGGLLLFGGSINAQNFIETGNLSGNCGWDYFSRGGCSSAYFNSSAGSSMIWTGQALGTGSNYFRLFTDWGGAQQRHEPNATTQLLPNTEYTLNSNWGTANANFINAPNTTWNYVFKTPNGDGINNTPQVIIFEVQGAIKTVASVSQNPLAVNPGSAATISADVSGTGPLPAGQGVYLRYTDNGYTTSTVVEMAYSGSGQTYTATIPATTNINGAVISYYVFTSGAGLTITGPKADWYTINLNNNGGLNYTYTVSNIWTTSAAGSGVWSDPLSWDPGTIPPVGVPVWIEDNLLLDMDAEISSITILPTVTFTSDDGSNRTLRIQNGGTFTNNGILTAPGGNIHFLGIGTITGSQQFSTVRIAGGVNFGTNSRISDTLKIMAGGFVNTLPPTYMTNSVLEYATGSTFGAPYGRSLEWSMPYHVAITGNTWLDWPNGNNLTPISMLGNLHIVSGGLYWRDAERPFSVAGNVIVESGGTLEMSTLVGGDLYVAGNLTNQGTFNGNNRTVRFNGTAPQQIFGDFTGTNRFHYFDINNPAGLTPMTDIEIEDTIRFFDGVISLASNHLTFTETGTISPVPAFAPKSNSMIATNGTGEVRKIFAAPGAFTYPVGDDSGVNEYSPCTITFTSGTFAPGAFLGLKVTDLKHPLNPAVTHYLTRFWEAEESGITGFTYDCVFNYTDADIFGVEANIIGLKSDDGGLNWLSLPNVNAFSNEVWQNGLTGFSLFTGGESALLGVEWAYFNGYKVGNAVQLDWATTREWNADYFVVEKSTDGAQYHDLVTVQANGNAQQINSYDATDFYPAQGWNWYKLRQVDVDGSVNWSDDVRVYFQGNAEIQPENFQPYGHDAYIYAKITADVTQDWEIEVFDLSGKRLLHNRLNALAGTFHYPIGSVSLGFGNVVIVRGKSGQTVLSHTLLLH